MASAQPTASLPTTLRSPPVIDAYTPLAEHQSRTPVSFFEGPPVLHYHRTGARAYVSRENAHRLPWGGSVAADTAGDAWPVMGDDMVGQVVDVFVGSDPLADVGVALPYPIIGLHAIKSAHTADDRRVPTIYMQLELSSAGADEEAFDTVELTVVPDGASVDDTSQPTSEASRLFDAISACADLHPDRFGDDDDDDGRDAYPSFMRASGENGENGEYDDDYDDDEPYYEEDGDDGTAVEPIEGFRGVFRGAAAAATSVAAAADLPPPMPGSGGWITAENAHEFFDDDGNWRGRGGSLGEGAGRVRGRDEVETGETAAASAADMVAAADDAPTGESTTTAGAAASSNGQGAANGDETESKRLRTD